MEWINVNERLPELEQIVFLCMGKDNSIIHVGSRTIVEQNEWYWGVTYDSPYYLKERGWEADIEADDEYNPNFWMPLPEPPSK